MAGLRIIFMGTPEIAVPSLEALVSAGHEIAAVVTQPDKPRGRGQKLAAGPVKAFAEERGLRVLQPERLKAEYRDRVSFHGGIDMQHLLTHGSPDDVEAAVRRYCTCLGRGGGYMVGPAHLFQPDVPPENIVAMCDEVVKAGRYPLAISDTR